MGGCFTRKPQETLQEISRIYTDIPRDWIQRTSCENVSESKRNLYTDILVLYIHTEWILVTFIIPTVSQS